MNFLFGAILLFSAFLFLVILLDDVRFVRRRYVLRSSKLKRPVRLVLLSDLHGKRYGRGNEVLLSAIAKEAPDLVLSAGDLVTASRGGEDAAAALELISGLSKRSLPVYYAMGNHEQRLLCDEKKSGSGGAQEKAQAGPVYLQAAVRAGAHLLQNESFELEEANLTVHGLSLDLEKHLSRFCYEPPTMEELRERLGEPKEGRFHVLIAHDPEYYDMYDAWGADLVLSGHIHGGILRLPIPRRGHALGWGVLSPRLTLFPKYDGGLFPGKNGALVVSRGLGTHTLPIRVFNPAELVVIDLLPEEGRGEMA